MRILGCLVVCAVGCGGDPVAPDATSVDAEEASIIASVAGTIDLDSTSVGQGATASMTLTNGGANATGPIALAIQGTHANDFAFDNQLTTCAGAALVPGATCTIAIVFRPMAAGARTATLTYASTPGGSGSVILAGPGVMPDLHFMPTSLDFATVRTGTGTSVPIELRNDGSGPAPIDSITISGAGFSQGLSTCGATLAASSSCDITVTFTSSTLGARTGSVAVSSAGSVYSAPLSATGARSLTVTKTGTGTGTITSSPVGIDCGGTCTALFPGDGVLTAVPGASSVLTGWSIAACGTSLTCMVPGDVSAITVTANFALVGSASLALTFAGDGSGEVLVRRGSTPAGTLATCFASCTVPIEPGDQIEIYPATVSTFGGLSGACTSATGSCSFTAGVGTSAVTATFTKNAKERWTRLIPGTVTSVAYDGSGNLIVGTNAALTKLSSTGSTVWSIPMGVSAIDCGPGDSIYVVHTNGLEKLTPSGGSTWLRTLPTGVDGSPGLGVFPNHLAVGADGAVVVQGTSAFARWDSAGTMTWSRAGASMMRQGIGIEPGGAIVVARLATEDIFGDRFAAADGAPLTGLGDIGDQYGGSLDIDANGRLVTSYSGHGSVLIHYSGLGYVTDFLGAGAIPNGIASSLTGDVVSGYQTGSGGGWTLRRLTAAATEAWVLNRNLLASPFGSLGTSLFNVAVSSTGQAAAVGSYRGHGTSSGWVQVFDP